MGLRDILTGRHEVKGPAPDRLFAISTAYVALQTEHQIEPAGAAAIVFQALQTSEFEATIKDMEEVVKATGGDSGTQVHTEDDSFGYRWMVLRDDSVEDLAVGINAVSGSIETAGHGERLLARLQDLQHPGPPQPGQHCGFRRHLRERGPGQHPGRPATRGQGGRGESARGSGAGWHGAWNGRVTAGWYGRRAAGERTGDRGEHGGPAHFAGRRHQPGGPGGDHGSSLRRLPGQGPMFADYPLFLVRTRRVGAAAARPEAVTNRAGRWRSCH